MKKNKIYTKLSTVHLMLCTLILMTAAACDDAINVDPDDEIVESNAIVDVDDVERATIGVYATIPANNAIYWNSLFTDELKLPSSNTGNGVQVHTWSINSADGTAAAIFGGYYVTINRANRVLEAINSIEVNSGNEVRMNKAKGELLAIRAWAHFKLLTFFSTSYVDDSALAIPYIDYVVVLEKPARNTVGEVFANIDEDLVEAFSLLPSDFSDNIFFTRNAIIALESRIALYREDYSTAIAKSSQLISQYPLTSVSDYPEIWQDINDEENIFKLARVQGDGAIGQVYNANAQLILWIASDKLTNSYDSNDIRLYSFIDPTSQKIVKYPGDASAVGLNDIKLFRISEQYLIRAEAYANTSQINLAENDINTLRSNRFLVPSPLTFNGQSDAIMKILDERFLELAFEGHRYHDLKRTGLDVERGSSDCDFLAAENACILPNSNFKFTLPIPQGEIFANTNMIQNPGYNN